MLVSQRAEVEIIRFLGTPEMKRNLEIYLARQRGAAPTPLEGIVALYVVGFMWEEIREVYERHDVTFSYVNVTYVNVALTIYLYVFFNL